MYRIIIHHGDGWRDTGEGPFDLAADAVNMASAECGMPWVVIDDVGQPHAFGDANGQSQFGDRNRLIVRTDNGTGEKELVSWERAKEAISAAYHDVDGIMRAVALGHPIRCTFATYQHRDFVEGFERPTPKGGQSCAS